MGTNMLGKASSERDLTELRMLKEEREEHIVCTTTLVKMKGEERSWTSHFPSLASRGCTGQAQLCCSVCVGGLGEG